MFFKNSIFVMGAFSLVLSMNAFADGPFPDPTDTASAPKPQVFQPRKSGPPVTQNMPPFPQNMPDAPAAPQEASQDSKKDKDKDEVPPSTSMHLLTIGPSFTTSGQGENHGYGLDLGYNFVIPKGGFVGASADANNGNGGQDTGKGGYISGEAHAVNAGGTLWFKDKAGNELPLGARFGVNFHAMGNAALGQNSSNGAVNGDVFIAPDWKIVNAKNGTVVSVGCYLGGGGFYATNLLKNGAEVGGAGIMPCTGGFVRMETSRLHLDASARYLINLSPSVTQNSASGLFQADALALLTLIKGQGMHGGIFLQGGLDMATDVKLVDPSDSNTSSKPAVAFVGKAGFMLALDPQTRQPASLDKLDDDAERKDVPPYLRPPKGGSDDDEAKADYKGRATY